MATTAPLPIPLEPEDDQEAVAANIRALMGRYRISQSRLARAVGMSPAGLSERLNGKTNFTVRELGKIARVFGKSISDVVTPLVLLTTAALYVTRNEDPPQYNATEVAVQLSLFEGTTADTSPAHITLVHKEAA